LPGFWDSKAGNGSQTTPASTSSTTTGCSTVKGNGTCTETLTVQNEGFYWWDFSVGVPFTKVTDLQYGSTGVTPQKVSKQTAYGFLVIAPWKEDVLSPPSLGIPHLLFGLPFTGKVLNNPFVGAGETINLTKLPGIGNAISKFIPNLSIRPYAGLVEHKQFGRAPKPGESGPITWVGKLQFGIEFSVRDVAGKLTGASSSTANSSSSSSKQKNGS
jgi:hypothetical protein